MYSWLRRYLPSRLAELLLILWYAGLILLVLHCLGFAPGDFRYGQL